MSRFPRFVPSRSVVPFAIALTLSLSACVVATPPVVVAPPPPMTPMPPTQDRCNAERARSAIGKAATAPVVEQARIDARADIARVLRPGQVVTMEFREGRLNVDVNERNAVIGLRCG